MFVTGCSANISANEKEHKIDTNVIETDKPADEESMEEAASVKEDASIEEPTSIEIEDNLRPVITHKYDTIILTERLGGLMDFSENVQSVIDPEDGELPYNNIGGFVGQQPDDFWYNITHNDNVDIVTTYGSGFYFSMGNSDLNTPDGIHPITTFAYDSSGQLATKEYALKYIPYDESSTGEVATVTVEGLNVRNAPSTSATIVGVCWPNAGYQVIETAEADGYTWYCIGDGMWIADNGEWITVN